MRKVIFFLNILSCYHYYYKFKEQESFKIYTCSRKENLIQVAVKGFPILERSTSNISELESEIIELINYSERMKFLSSKNAINEAIREIRNIVYALKIGNIKLSDYSSSKYFKYEVDKLISLNAEIIDREWNDKYECELIMSFDISLINNIIKDKIIKKHNDK